MIVLVITLGLGITITALLALEDRDPGTFIIGILVTLVVTAIISLFADLFYERAAFAARTACMSKRLAAERQFLSTNVVCVPAYRDTKNDTTTVNLNSK